MSSRFYFSIREEKITKTTEFSFKFEKTKSFLLEDDVNFKNVSKSLKSLSVIETSFYSISAPRSNAVKVYLITLKSFG